MAVKTFRPYTPSRRKMSVLDNSNVITKSTPEKSLLARKVKTSGRNNQGKITVRHHGGGNKQKYRIVDFKRKKDGIVGKVVAIEYDPNRTANIALIYYKDGTKAYILAPDGLAVGSEIMSGEKAEAKVQQTVVPKTVTAETKTNAQLKPEIKEESKFIKK